jgi:hypothetical protein
MCFPCVWPDFVSRTARICIYEEDSTRHQPALGSQGRAPVQQPESSARPSLGPIFPATAPRLEPFRDQASRQDTVDMIVRGEALKILGSWDAVPPMAEKYFTTVHLRLTTLSRGRFLSRLQNLPTTAPAEYLTLCLCMRLILDIPLGVDSMHSSLYVTLKSIMSLLTATGVYSLDFVHCWVLIAFYEFGHAIHPACSMSLAACAKLARVIGLHREISQPSRENAITLETEERRRVWWAVLNMER